MTNTDTDHRGINHRGTDRRNPDHGPLVRSALERSRARRDDAEQQLRALRGTAQAAPLAELDSLLAYEVRLESRLSELLHRSERTHRDVAVAAC